jgi:hypothetical protein
MSRDCSIATVWFSAKRLGPELCPRRAGEGAISLYPSCRQPRSAAGNWESLLPRHGDADSLFRRDEVIEALSVLGNGELDALDDSVKLVPSRPVVG